MLIDDDCPFCLLVDDDQSPCWTELGRSDAEVLWNSQDYALILDTAPLTEGHSLLVTKRHVTAMNLAANADRYWSLTTELIRNTYGAVTAFEHGALSSKRNAGACVDHAHAHFVPGSFPNLSSMVRADYRELRAYPTRADALAAMRGQPYLLLESSDGLIECVPAPACSTQYLRRLMATCIGRPDRWNWRDCIRRAKYLNLNNELDKAKERMRTSLDILEQQQL